MNKIQHEASAFARLAMMSRKGVHVVVEGKILDRTFYDRLLSHYLSGSGIDYEVRLAEQISLDGKSAGGKPFAHKLFDYFDSRSLLSQSVADGSRRIVFMLDRDYEHLSGKAKQNAHIVYTETSDVEAEILTHSRLRSAIESTYSLTSQHVALFASDDLQIPNELAEKWRLWIALKVLASRMETAADIQHGSDSMVNLDKYGDIDEKSLTSIVERMRSASVDSGFDALLDAVIFDVDRIFEEGRGRFLLKGKWISTYVNYLICQRVSDPVQSGVRPSSLASAAIESVDFTAAWAEHYHKRLDQVLN